MIDPTTLAAFEDELEKIAAYKRMHKAKRFFGKIKRMHKKRRVPRMHKKWKRKQPGSGGGGGGSQ